MIYSQYFWKDTIIISNESLVGGSVCPSYNMLRLTPTLHICYITVQELHTHTTRFSKGLPSQPCQHESVLLLHFVTWHLQWQNVCNNAMPNIWYVWRSVIFFISVSMVREIIYVCNNDCHGKYLIHYHGNRFIDLKVQKLCFYNFIILKKKIILQDVWILQR